MRWSACCRDTRDDLPGEPGTIVTGLDQCAQRLENALRPVIVDGGDAQAQQSRRPVERLRDAWPFLEIHAADALHELDQLARELPGDFGHTNLDDRQLLLEAGIVDVLIKAPAAERVGELARAI